MIQIKHLRKPTLILVCLALLISILPAAALADGPRTDFGGITIVVDAGHGGRDPGAIGPNGLTEANAALQISQNLAGMLRQRGANVIMTRGDDTFVELNARPALANQAGANAFVSVHLNTAASPATNGTEVYHFSPESAALAAAVHGNVVNDLGLPARGVRTANFAVINKNNMPAILAEVAFLSNPEEAAGMATPERQTTAATALFKGLKEYFGVTDPPPAPAPTVTPPPAPAQQESTVTTQAQSQESTVINAPEKTSTPAPKRKKTAVHGMKKESAVVTIPMMIGRYLDIF